MIAPVSRAGRPAPAPREIVAEVAAILATGYLRLRDPATGHVREIEAPAAATREEAEQQSLSPAPREPSCDRTADRPPSRRPT